MSNLLQRLARLRPYLRPGRRGLIGAALGALVGAATEPAIPALLKPLLDEGFGADRTWPLWWVPVLIVGLFALRGFAGFVAQYGLAWAAQRAVLALRSLGLEAWYAGLNDITASGGKIGGAAQARRFNAVLHHVTMAYDMNGDLLNQVLRVGKEKLSDKGIQSAAKRVGPLRQQTDLPREALIEHFIAAFAAQASLSEGALTPAEIAVAEELIEKRFATDDWVNFLP